MTNDAYISALKKALSQLDKQVRTDIIREIQSHASETSAPLIERFGPPAQLAQQYLDGESLPAPLTTQAWTVGKKLAMGIGFLALTVVAIGSTAYWWLTADEFNYADEQAAALTDNQRSWSTIDWDGDLELSLEQASVVIYWHDQDTVRVSCKGDHRPKRDGQQLQLYRGKCLIYLPRVATHISSYQAELVLVHPQIDLDLELKQSALEVAANGEQYNYVIESRRTKMGELDNDPNAATTLRIQSEEASLMPYQH